MTDFLREHVPPVPALSKDAIEEVARSFLTTLVPDFLLSPQPLDLINMIDSLLPEFGIHVCPASHEEIGDRAGATDPQGDGEIDILVSETVWDSLEESPPTCYFARTTVSHEIGHAVLHVPVLRRRLLLEDALNRTQRANLPAYLDPEWQAWMFAGSILMPRFTLNMLAPNGRLSITQVSQVYEISVQMVRSHLKRIKWTDIDS